MQRDKSERERERNQRSEGEREPTERRTHCRDNKEARQDSGLTLQLRRIDGPAVDREREQEEQGDLEEPEPGAPLETAAAVRELVVHEELGLVGLGAVRHLHEQQDNEDGVEERHLCMCTRDSSGSLAYTNVSKLCAHAYDVWLGAAHNHAKRSRPEQRAHQQREQTCMERSDKHGAEWFASENQTLVLCGRTRHRCSPFRARQPTETDDTDGGPRIMNE